ncbi:MAG: hypothetical protein ABIQ57_16600 [Candidatus Kapaibacterium sp.]
MPRKTLLVRGTTLLLGATALISIASFTGCKDDTTAPSATVVTVTVKDDTVLVTPYNLKTGKTMFKVTNAGTKSHALEAEEAATKREARTAILAPGASANLTNMTTSAGGGEIVLTEGVWEFYDSNDTLEFPKVEIDVTK